LLAAGVLDICHRGGDRLQLLLRLIPIALLDQALHLGHLGLGRERNPIVTDRLRFTEQGGAHPVQRVARSGAGDDGSETAEAEHRGRHRTHDGQMPTGACVGRLLLQEPAVNGFGCLTLADQSTRRWPTHTVAPTLEQRQHLRFAAVTRRHPVLACQRVEQPVTAGDCVEGFTAVARSLRTSEVSAPSEIRHSRIPSP
jgi:hypothetical protein